MCARPPVRKRWKGSLGDWELTWLARHLPLQNPKLHRTEGHLKSVPETLQVKQVSGLKAPAQVRTDSVTVWSPCWLVPVGGRQRLPRGVSMLGPPTTGATC